MKILSYQQVQTRSAIQSGGADGGGADDDKGAGGSGSDDNGRETPESAA